MTFNARNMPNNNHILNKDIKPSWLKSTWLLSPKLSILTNKFRQLNLSTVCQEAHCPNIGECYNKGVATFLIMGNRCTRNCRFCNIAHGKPEPLDPHEATNIASIITDMQLKYVVITSVTRDDLLDGGASHFSQCISNIRKLSTKIKIEILVPDFKNKLSIALKNLSFNLPNVFNHNIETVPHLYPKIRQGASYHNSLLLLSTFKKQFPNILTKSGLMVGLGETLQEIKSTLIDLKENKVDMITIGQYLSPSAEHYPVYKYVHPEEFKELEIFCKKIGFAYVASGPLIRSSYMAELQENHQYVYR